MGWGVRLSFAFLSSDDLTLVGMWWTLYQRSEWLRLGAVDQLGPTFFQSKIATVFICQILTLTRWRKILISQNRRTKDDSILPFTMTLSLVSSKWGLVCQKRFKNLSAVMGLKYHFCFFSSVERRWFTFLIPIRKRWNHSAYAVSVLIRPLWDRYGSPLWRDGSSYLFKWLEKEKAEDRDALPMVWDINLRCSISNGSLISLWFSFTHPVFKYWCSQSSSKVYTETVQSLSVWQVYLLGSWTLALTFKWVSTWVYQSVRSKKWIYLFAAYGLHALFDLAPALSLWVGEAAHETNQDC